MTQVNSFSPVSDQSAQVLILGSMPGVVSLNAQEYYAHPRNCFWRIMCEIIGCASSAPYPVRLEALKRAGVALWDVLHACVRPGSADSAIKSGTRVTNDFEAFFNTHPKITLVCFNGTEAEKSYNKYVLPRLNLSNIKYLRLPSTSPAYAALTYEKKRDAWRSAINTYLNCYR